MMGTRTMPRRARALVSRFGLLAAAGVVAMATACGDDDVTNIVVTPITGAVQTFKDSTYNFTGLRTFAMPDTVVHFAPLTGTPLDVSRQFDAATLERVRQNFLARGYQQVNDPRTTKPDFVVLVGATATTNYNAWVGYSWYGTWGFYSGWGWYAPGFDTSWGIVYPWQPYIGVTAYDRGTLIVDLIPTLSVTPVNKTIRSAWAGVATGLIAGGDLTQTRINAAVDEMFRQSPYLTAPTAGPAR